MSEKRFAVICTGQGQHGRIDWPEVILADDGTIREKRTRQAPLNPGGPTRKVVVPAEGHRAANGTWRWKCPRCGIDRPLSEHNLRAWMKATTGELLDISMLPR